MLLAVVGRGLEIAPLDYHLRYVAKAHFFEKLRILQRPEDCNLTDGN
jgi:hypothetical protein